MKIYYISDLHLDYRNIEEVSKFLSLFNKNDIYIIAGDLYNNFVNSLVIINYLENNKIHGYFVLGNHEYIFLAEPPNVNINLKKTEILTDKMFKIYDNKYYDYLLEYVKKNTKDNKYFKFLYTGKVFTLNNKWKIIGDTGWSSFKYENGNMIDDYKKYEWNHTTNWKWMDKQNKMFMNFLNNSIKKYKNLLVVTHHPLYFPKLEDIKNSRLKNKAGDEILFWFSYEKINKSKNKILFIHGHTHTEPFFKDNFSNASGRNNDAKEIKLEELNLD